MENSMAKSKRGGKPKSPNLPHLYARLRRCSTRQRLAVCCFMSELVNRSHIATAIDRIARECMSCPRCASRRFCRHGFANGLQRYRCRDCARTFNGLTGTPLARLRLKHKWLAYCDCLRDAACTVKSAAEKVAVHPNTSFRWRHRFLQWAKLDRPASLQGIAEADETFLLESEKGNKQLARTPRKRGGVASKRGISDELVNIVVARDRSGATIDFIAGRGALKASALHTHLLPKLQPDVMLVTDANAAYRAFSREAGIDHQAINLRQGVRKRMHGQLAIHVQNVNAYHGRFKGWLRHFNGVATRYLDNYLGWRWAIDMGRIASAEGFLRAALCGFNGRGR
jgi:transposase-like protein